MLKKKRNGGLLIKRELRGKMTHMLIFSIWNLIMKKSILLVCFCASLHGVADAGDWLVGGKKRVEGSEFVQYRVPSERMVLVKGDVTLDGGAVRDILEVDGWLKATDVEFNKLAVIGTTFLLHNCTVRGRMYASGYFEASSCTLKELFVHGSQSVNMRACTVDRLKVDDARADIDLSDCHVDTIEFVSADPGIVRVHGRSCVIGKVVNGTVEHIA